MDWRLLHELPYALNNVREDIEMTKFLVAHGQADLCFCDEFDDEGHPTDAGLAAAEQTIMRVQNWTPVAWWFYSIYRRARVLLEVGTCCVIGHRLVDNSYGGPEAGCVAAHCTRCGWSFHHTLY